MPFPLFFTVSFSVSEAFCAELFSALVNTDWLRAFPTAPPVGALLGCKHQQQGKQNRGSKRRERVNKSHSPADRRMKDPAFMVLFLPCCRSVLQGGCRAASRCLLCSLLHLPLQLHQILTAELCWPQVLYEQMILLHQLEIPSSSPDDRICQSTEIMGKFPSQKSLTLVSFWRLTAGSAAIDHLAHKALLAKSILLLSGASPLTLTAMVRARAVWGFCSRATRRWAFKTWF